MNFIPTPPGPPRDTPLVKLAKALEKLPKYLIVDFLIGLIESVLVDPINTAMAIAAIFVGLAAGSWEIAIAFFFTIYVLSHLVGLLARGAGSVGGAIIQAGQTAAAATREANQPPFAVGSPPDHITALAPPAPGVQAPPE